MNYVIKIPKEIVEISFRNALSYPKITRGNFFSDIRKAFKAELETLFEKQGIIVNRNQSLGYTNFSKNSNLFNMSPITKVINSKKDILVKIDAVFCAGYGHDDYSLRAINYIDREMLALPSLLPFRAVENFSLGNIAILIENKNYQIAIETDEGINLAGYTYDISDRKRKSYICLLGIHFSKDIILNIFQESTIQCNHLPEILDEIRIDNSFFPVTFICRNCGKVLTCSCFEEYLNIKNGLTVRGIDITVKENICHLCTGDIPRQEYLCSPTPSAFLKRYMPYQYLFSLKKYRTFIFPTQKEYKEIENEVREAFNYPKIGEKWISETILYKMVQVLFPSLDVIHHYRGKELEGLEIDIWIPSLKIGIEYQGIQHFEIIEHWGGEDGLRKRKQNDQKKKELCKSLGYKLIEFRYDENLTEKRLQNKLKSILF
ncbi:PDDEXK family nuclease [Pseudanabaena yagii]|uniref:DUF559 domain-containing protein n=1 Tax=Pseudanabaena yagii GIHE-NHR1 TaxID=2722753 RepID=A0ABX1LQX4_9CYAN|nr:hypothetical protein [Pseudanabaena yagii]NMF57906.1 hypothetical protein [Pseudanabaena yagii GIHE-NHR1]